MIEDREFLAEERKQDDYAIRPDSFAEFVGQQSLIENLEVFIEAASIRKESLDHCLFSGPPGLGKTSLARIIAETQGQRFHMLAAPNLRRPGDLVKILTALEKMDVLFIDEIHRLPAPVEETLYSAMEDRKISITLADGLAAQIVQLDLPPFTLVGATTKIGSLSAPLRDRFGIKMQLEYYSDKELNIIIQRACQKLNFFIETDAVDAISSRSRRTPRVAIRLLKRIQDYATVQKVGSKTSPVQRQDIEAYFDNLEIDQIGLTKLDLRFLDAMIEHFRDRPVGLKPLAAFLGEDIINLEEFIEPFLVQSGFIIRSERGRVLTQKALLHRGVKLETPGELFE